MDTASLIAIYLPVFIIFFVVLPQQYRMKKIIAVKRQKLKGVKCMTNELLKKYVGMNCSISTAAFGTSLLGKIIEINENWIEVETKKGIEIINSDYVQSVKIVKP